MTVILSGGRATPVASKSWPLDLGPRIYRGPSAGTIDLLRGDGLTATFDAMYKTQPNVYAVVSKIVNAVARSPFLLFNGSGAPDERVRVYDSPLNRVLRKPFKFGSPSRLKTAFTKDLHIHGKALLVKFRAEGAGAPPSELWPVPWRFVQIISDNSGPLGYKIQMNGASTFVAPEDAIYFELPDGISPLDPLRRTLALEDAAMTFQSESFRNGVTGRGAFTTEQVLREASLPVLRGELEKLYAGPENAGRFGLFDQGLKFTTMGSSAVDVELVGQRKLSREEVCSVYDFSPQLIGVADNTQAGVVYEMRKALYDAIAGKLLVIEETLQSQLIDPEPAWDGLEINLDTSRLTAADPEQTARTFMMEQQSSTTTTNERRLRSGLPKIDHPEADLVLVPMNMTPIGTPRPAPGAGTPAGTPEQGGVDPALATASLLDASIRATSAVTEQRT